MAKRKAAVPKKQPSRSRTTASSSVSAATEGLDLSVAVDENQAPVENGAATAATQPTESHDPSPDHNASPEHNGNSSARHKSRLDVYLIDSGWNTPVGAAVHENIPTLAAYLKDQRFFVLNQEQSLKFIQSHPALAGADPILLVVDRQASKEKKTVGCGFRLCLGHVKQPEVAIAMLKWAMQLTMTVDAVEMSKLVEKSGHRKSIQGVIELMGEGSAHLLEFAPV